MIEGAFSVILAQSGTGTESGRETGTVGNEKLQEPKAGPEPSEPLFRKQNGAPLLRSTETQGKPFPGGTVRTKNRSRSNRPVHELDRGILCDDDPHNLFAQCLRQSDRRA